MVNYTVSGVPFQMDEEDLYIFKEFPKIYTTSDGYIGVQRSGARDEPTFKLHRLIMKCPEGMVVDHINHDKHDNRKCNLRICTRAENNKNIKKVNISNATSKYKGVRWHRGDQKWAARIQVNKTEHWLGNFDTEVAAAERYDDAAEHFFKEFAVFNFPKRQRKPYVKTEPLKKYSLHKGISFKSDNRTNPWSARVQIKGKVWSMSFATEQEAIAAWTQVQKDLAEGKPLPESPKKASPKYSNHPGITKDIRKVSKPWKAKVKVKGVILWQANFLTEQEAIDALTAYKKEHNLP